MSPDVVSWNLTTITWDTTSWDGQQVRVRVTDNSTSSHLGIDEVRVVTAPSGTMPAWLGGHTAPFPNANSEDGG